MRVAFGAIVPVVELAWTELPVLVRRTVDELITTSGVSYHREGVPYSDGDDVVVPLVAPEGPAEAVVSPDGAGTIRKLL